MGITEGKIFSGTLTTGALTANRIAWEKAPMVELEIKCPICGVVVRTIAAAESIEYSLGPHGSSTMRIEGAPVDLSAHLATAHTDAQWRDAYFVFRPVDAVAEKKSSAHTHGWRQG